jgi:hypothetical protein
MPINVVDIIAHCIKDNADKISGAMNDGGWEKDVEGLIIDSIPIAARSPSCYENGFGDIVIHDETGQEDAIVELKCMKPLEGPGTFVSRVKEDNKKITTKKIVPAFRNNRFWSIGLAKTDKHNAIGICMASTIVGPWGKSRFGALIPCETRIGEIHN